MELLQIHGGSSPAHKTIFFPGKMVYPVRGGDGVQMKIKIIPLIVYSTCSLLMAGCAMKGPMGQAYWQRVEDSSALYMTGPKAQQELDENIATCVREIDELVRLDALRGTMPPDTHSEYHHALKASGDLDYYDTPTTLGEKHVSHSDYHDYESCMRSKGWERVKYIRYQTALKARNVYTETQQYRMTGLTGDAAEAKQKQMIEEAKSRDGLNQ